MPFIYDNGDPPRSSPGCRYLNVVHREGFEGVA